MKLCPLDQGFPLPTVGLCSQSTCHSWMTMHIRIFFYHLPFFLLPPVFSTFLASTHLTNYSQDWSMSVLSVQLLLLIQQICIVNYPQVLATASCCSSPWLSSPVSYVLGLARLSIGQNFPILPLPQSYLFVFSASWYWCYMNVVFDSRASVFSGGWTFF